MAAMSMRNMKTLYLRVFICVYAINGRYYKNRPPTATAVNALFPAICLCKSSFGRILPPQLMIPFE